MVKAMRDELFGSEVARIARAFGMEVIACSENLAPEKAQEHGARRVSRQELFQESDILTIHLVLSSRTRGLVGKFEFGLMKASARLVNTSRGPIVDEKALVDALRTGRIAGAAIDVFDVEPLPRDHADIHAAAPVDGRAGRSVRLSNIS